MPISHFTKSYGSKDAKASLLTADPAGGAPAYATSIDLPGIKKVIISGDVETKQLRGDNTKLDSDTTLTNIKAELEIAKLDLDLLAMWLSQTVVDAGTTPNQTATLDITGGGASTLRFRPFKLAVITATSDQVAGNVGFTLWKCVLNAFPELGTEEEDYKTVKVGVDASPLISNGKWLTPSINETALVLT